MFSSIICNDYEQHTICISNDNFIYSFGYSEYKSHGHKKTQISYPKKIKKFKNIKLIDCGVKHTICLNFDGEVFSFGSNNSGQLGIGKDNNELITHIPQKINLPSCKQVSCGNTFSICLTEDNNLYSFGSNYYGQLGLRNTRNFNSPQLIPDINNIEFIICGGYHSICFTYNNEFYSWGSNKFGQLGNGSNNAYYKPIQRNNWPDNIISVKCGTNYSLLLTSEGQVYSFGNNKSGQLGINDNNIKSVNIPTLIYDIPEIQRIECGRNHSMCIDINNNLWIFGDNSFSQLGLGDQENIFKPILHPTLSNIMDISSRGNHTFVKTIDNKIYAFGHNKYSQLGIKTSEINQITPIQVLKGNENIWCTPISKSKTKSARK